MEDTICAISTSLGNGAISIVRVTGPDAVKIVDSIFDGNLTDKETHTIHYGHIKYNNEVIDEVLVMLMRGPKTYTTEDTVEINCHGGKSTTEKVLEILLSCGCRLAEPGEFTKRAFLNGRINLLEAESVNDLIVAKTDAARTLAINNVDGILTKKIRNIREKIEINPIKNQIEIIKNVIKYLKSHGLNNDNCRYLDEKIFKENITNSNTAASTPIIIYLNKQLLIKLFINIHYCHVSIFSNSNDIIDKLNQKEIKDEIQKIFSPFELFEGKNDPDPLDYLYVYYFYINKDDKPEEIANIIINIYNYLKKQNL